jgi:hypothetical protein
LNGFSRFLFSCVLLQFFSCYQGHGLSPTAPDSGSGIKGRVYFKGTWPDSTNRVFVIVSKTYPKGITDRDSLLAFVLQNLNNGNILIGDTVPNFVGTFDYQVSLQPGRYEWVLVAWFPADLFGVKELGAYYRDPGDQILPTPIDVIPGVVIEGLNIEADFVNVKRTIPFFKTSGKK